MKNRSGQAWLAERCLGTALQYGSRLCSGQAWPSSPAVSVVRML